MENYRIEKDGRVWSNISNKYLKPEKMANGYLRYEIGGKHYFAHRLVASTYLPNPNNLPCINHKDCNRANNNVNNLEWVSYQENNIYKDRIEKSANAHKKPVRQMSMDGQFIRDWNSPTDAEKVLGIKNIYRAANGTRKSCGGFRWEYIGG